MIYRVYACVTDVRPKNEWKQPGFTFPHYVNVDDIASEVEHNCFEQSAWGYGKLVGTYNDYQSAIAAAESIGTRTERWSDCGSDYFHCYYAAVTSQQEEEIECLECIYCAEYKEQEGEEDAE